MGLHGNFNLSIAFQPKIAVSQHTQLPIYPSTGQHAATSQQPERKLA
jgi:hypothetical protein